jgi:ATP-dependent RNA helicase RhlE
MSFENLGLSQPVLQALALKDYSAATPIQTQAIPTLLKGRDLLGIAQTGTGKTAAFMLPSIDRLAASGKRPQRGACRMLVLAPTRELASQIAESARAYSRFAHMSVATVFGGTSIGKNKQDISRGVDILVATPGRLIDLVEQRWLDLRDVEILVLDEADQMLDLGFIHDLKRIVRMLPAKRQSLFFSATMPRAIQELADKFLTDPAQVAVTPVSSTVERVEQYVTFVTQPEKPALLTLLLRRDKMDRVLIFSRTKHGADRIVKQLAQSGIPANAIHGNKSQPQRERALAEFKAGKVKILIATDIAARGIDVSGVSHVINFDLPNVSEQYVHRIGRTARAGAAGIAIAFCAEDERAYLKGIERLTKQRIEVVALPENFVSEANRIKAERASSGIADRPERGPRGEPREDRNRVRRPKSRRPNFGAAGAPKTNRARRRASGR